MPATGPTKVSMPQHTIYRGHLRQMDTPFPDMARGLGIRHVFGGIFVEHQPKLADIGMITANTASPSHVGTPDYMPPDGQMDLTADTYAIGGVLHKLMVGPRHSRFPRLPLVIVAKVL